MVSRTPQAPQRTRTEQGGADRRAPGPRSAPSLASRLGELWVCIASIGAVLLEKASRLRTRSHGEGPDAGLDHASAPATSRVTGPGLASGPTRQARRQMPNGRARWIAALAAVLVLAAGWGMLRLGSAGGPAEAAGAAAEPVVGSAEQAAMRHGTAAVSWPSPKTYWACDAPIWPADVAREQARQPGAGERVLVLGDSLTHNVDQPLATALLAKGWLPTVDCYGGKTTLWGIEQLRMLEARSHLPSRVVIGLGTNDAAVDGASVARFSDRVRKLMDTLGPDRRVWWINLWVDLSKARAEGYSELDVYPQYNEALSGVLAQYPNAQIIDWERVVSDYQAGHGPLETTPDGIHPESDGNTLRISTITDALH